MNIDQELNVARARARRIALSYVSRIEDAGGRLDDAFPHPFVDDDLDVFQRQYAERALAHSLTKAAVVPGLRERDEQAIIQFVDSAAASVACMYGQTVDYFSRV